MPNAAGTCERVRRPDAQEPGTALGVSLKPSRRSGSNVQNEKLSAYRAKRDFGKTAEPSGEERTTTGGRRRFVIQKHAATRLHYDLRIEIDGVFKSWAVTKGPSLDPHDKRLAVEVEDHPLAYGDFEGTIPAGEYGGGTVMVWDRGYWEPEGPLGPEDALAKGDFKFRLEGEKLHGSWVLVRMKRNRPGDKRTNWLLIKHRDEFAVDEKGDAVLAQDLSVASGRTLDAIAAGEGKAPKAFVDQASPAARADAVWGQDEPVEAKPKAKHPAGKRPAKAVKDEASGAEAASHAKASGRRAAKAPAAARSSTRKSKGNETLTGDQPAAKRPSVKRPAKKGPAAKPSAAGAGADQRR
ncbi:hypothetical protein GCM10007036_18370 [Alsobacter metallidurans]|uniref:DNA ligase D 3'-phosphoesterase domain-containing protein n=1 Tax=Alsobacter metallidurans TaxID=340221 RepID=A0A917MJD7_9HYPH|nr:hypothetical protein GCM10007036_18370 [Alsobacter metallidurans]